MTLIIDRIFIAVLLLSVNGFVFCAIFLPFEKYVYNLTSAKVMVWCNTIALFSFIIPVYFIATILDNSEKIFTEYDLLVYEDASRYEWLVDIVRSWGFVKYLSVFWLAGVVLYLAYNLWKYYYLLNTIKRNMFQLEDDIWATEFYQLQSINKINNVMLISSSEIYTPCIVGIKKCYIIIPAYMINSFDAEEASCILKHEFYHAVHRDLPRKFLVAMLNCINWFNPLFLLLRKNLSDWIEVACDETITEDFDSGQRFRYCQLMIKISELERSVKSRSYFKNQFSENNMKVLKRRMERVMKNNGKRTWLGKAVATSIIMFSMISGSVVAKAADVPINMMFSEQVEVVEPGEFEIVGVEEFPSEDAFALSENETYEMLYEGTWQNIDVVTPGNGQIETNHLHQFIDITLKTHKKNSDGSCTTTYYEGKKCTVCGAVWKGDFIGTVTDEKCTH